MKPRPYQEEAGRRVLEEFESGCRSTLVVMPTGCGKTVLFVTLAQLTEGDDEAERKRIEAGKVFDSGTSSGTDMAGSGQGRGSDGEVSRDRNGGVHCGSARTDGRQSCGYLFDPNTNEW